jgi:SAM-dependent methyltransferase
VTTSNYKKARKFYDNQFGKEIYATSNSHCKSVEWVKSKLNLLSIDNPSILEIGCGRGYLQNVVHRYIGIDLSLSAANYMTKPFICGAAENLPFAEESFDIVMSFTVLEHLQNPEVALLEMKRVLRKGGVLILNAAWRVPPWRRFGIDKKRIRELSGIQKCFRLVTPLLNVIWCKGIFRLPFRLIREIKFISIGKTFSLPFTPLRPNWDDFLCPDSDATASVDNHACALWLHSRGFYSQETDNILGRIFLRCGTLVMVRR